jgi:hypothetical protein
VEPTVKRAGTVHPPVRRDGNRSGQFSD